MSSRLRFAGFVAPALAAALLAFLIAACPALHAQTLVPVAQQGTHLVTPGQLQQQLSSATTARQKNIDTLNQFLSTPQAEQAMRSAKIDPVQVRTAIPTLSSAQLANLSARAQHAQAEFAAGRLSNLLLGLIILLVVLVILLAVYH